MSRQTARSSGRGRGNSTGSDGFSYTSETTTIHRSSGGTHHVNHRRIHIESGPSSSRRPLGTIPEDGDVCDCDHCQEVLGDFSRMRIGDRMSSTISGPRLIELPDEDVDRSLSRRPSFRISSRPSESVRSRTRTMDSRQPSRQITSSRPAESRYSSSRPSESHYSGSRTSDSRRPTIRASSRAIEPRYSSSRPSESNAGRSGRDLVVYEEPVPQDSRSNGKTKTGSSRRDTGSKMSIMSGLKDLVKGN